VTWSHGLAQGALPQLRHGLGLPLMRAAASAPYPRWTTSGEQMMQWEYKLFTETLDADQLNALGAEGWELVMVVSPAHFVFHYFFKRQLRA
jgi:hypothetical protein